METKNGEDLGFSQDRDLPNGELSRRQAEVQGRMRREAQGNQSNSFGDPCEGARKGQGMMEAPGDGSEQGLKTLNGRKDLWLPGLDRESKLELVKSGFSYDIRAYKGERKPCRLYDAEEDEESKYKIPPGDVSPGRAQELEEERRELIRSQVVKRSTTVAEKWARPAEGEAGQSHSAGFFALCFDRPSASSSSNNGAPSEPPNVDTEQIRFAAARQQFLELEKANPAVVLRGRPRGSPQTPRGVRRGEEGQGFLRQGESPHLDTANHGRWGGSPERTEPAWQTRGPRSRGQAVTCPDTAGGNLDSSSKTPQEARRSSRDSLDLVASGPDPTEGSETPIEREIRLAREREEDHRRERGIPRVHSREEELVEIPARPLLVAAVSSSLASSPRRGKEKPLVSFCIQREVEQERKREEALRKEGRLPPTEAKDVQQELAERQRQPGKVFFVQETAEAPLPFPGRAMPRGEEQERTPNGEATGSHSTEGQGGRGTPVAVQTSRDPEAGRTPLAKTWPLSRRRPATTTCRPTDPPSPVGSESPAEEPVVVRKEHFAIPKLPFFTSGSQERPDGWQGESRATTGRPREELYTLRTWRPRTSALIDREIQEALEREQELQEQRRKVGLASQVTPDSRFSSQNSGKRRGKNGTKDRKR